MHMTDLGTGPRSGKEKRKRSRVSIPGSATFDTFVSPSADLKRAVVSYWRKYVHEVRIDRLGSLNLPRRSAVGQLTVPT